MPRPYGISVGRMARYTRNTVLSHQPITIAAVERLLAACATHVTQSNDPEIMQNFQQLLLVTMSDWRRRTDARDIPG